MNVELRPISEAPGPKGWPLLGNLPEVRRHGLLQYCEQLWRQYGDVFRIEMGWRSVVLSHPEAIKHVLASHRENYVKGVTYDGVRRVIGNGLLALEGDAWKSRRALVQPAFHKNTLGRLTQAMVETSAAHFDGLSARLGSGFTTLDAHREMVSLTLEVVVAALFGKNLSAAANVSYEALGAAMEFVSAGTNGFVLPSWVPTLNNLKFHRTMREVEGAVYRVISEGRRSPEEGTLLAMLLSSRDATTGEPLGDREVRDEVFTMFVAGHETTALLLTWMFTLLERAPGVLQRMRSEVHSVLGGRDPTFDDFSKLTYLRQVLEETLRLRGPVGMTARTAVADDEIRGHRVHAGDIVLPFFWGVHRHPQYWRDPEWFDPTRFAPENSRGRDPWSYLPFSGGQRMCIGNMFSLVEGVVITAMLLNRFELELLPNRDVEIVAMATLRPSKPVLIRLRPRRAQASA